MTNGMSYEEKKDEVNKVHYLCDYFSLLLYYSLSEVEKKYRYLFRVTWWRQRCRWRWWWQRNGLFANANHDNNDDYFYSPFPSCRPQVFPLFQPSLHFDSFFYDFTLFYFYISTQQYKKRHKVSLYI